MRNKQTLSSKRLTLELLSESNANFILDLVNTEGWIKFIGDKDIHSKEEALAYIQKINANESIRYWTVKLTEAQSTIGLITVIKRDYLEHNDIGFAFLPSSFKNGYAYEAARLVIQNLEEYGDISMIQAVTFPENISSIKVIEKLVLRYEKTVELDDKSLHVYHASIADIGLEGFSKL